MAGDNDCKHEIDRDTCDFCRPKAAVSVRHGGQTVSMGAKVAARMREKLPRPTTTAAHHSDCPECGNDMYGDVIVKADDDRWYHEECAEEE